MVPTGRQRHTDSNICTGPRHTKTLDPMNLPLPMWILIGLCWAISVWLALSLWKSKEPVWFKIVGTLVALIPIFGPPLYYFLEMPPRHPSKLRATMNHSGTGGRFIGFGSGRFNFDPVPDEKKSGASASPEDNTSSQPKRRLTGWEKVGLLVAFIFLTIYWTKALSYLKSENPWGHNNYWGQSVGTFLLIAMVMAGSAALIAILWRFWASRYFETTTPKGPASAFGPTTRSTRKRRKRRPR